MKNDNPTRPVVRLRRALIVTLAIGALFSLQAMAQMPGRFYWKTLSGANAVPLIFNSMSGNTNPFDPSHLVTPGAEFDATLVMAGYARTFALWDRAGMVAVILPMGRISGEVLALGQTVKQSAHGFGDPMIEFDLNLIGPKAQKNIPDALRYEPGFSVDLLADLALPIGEYDNSRQLNLGMHRWYGRLGAPIVWQLGAWVPGRRTTLEFLPAVWLFGANDDFVGSTLESDPTFQLDAHLTRDFTEHLWGAFDTAWYTGGKATIDGVEAEEGRNTVGLGFTLGYTINDNLALTCGYMSTVADNEPAEMQMDGLKFTLVFGWHGMVEGMKRLEGEKK